MNDERGRATPGLGALLVGRYRLEQRVGRGGMADVYLARDELLQRSVAVKLFRLESEETNEQLRIDAEMRTLAGLRHPGLVTLFDANAVGDESSGHAPFLVMEYIDGETLRRRLGSGPLSPEQTAQLGAEISSALGQVHAGGIVHRDIKPANILLEAGPTNVASLTAKLTDFGIAQLTDSARLTATGTTIGTANYLSPEQALGEPTGPGSDVYSLGLVLIECLTGSLAYPGTGIEAAVARLHRQPVVPSDLGPGWQALLVAMTDRDPQRRPTAVAVAAALETLAVTPADPVGGAVTTAFASPTQPTTALPTAEQAPTQQLPTRLAPAQPTRQSRVRLLLVIAAIVIVIALVGALFAALNASAPAGTGGPGATGGVAGTNRASSPQTSGSASGSTAAHSSASRSSAGADQTPVDSTVAGRLGRDLRTLEASVSGGGGLTTLQRDVATVAALAAAGRYAAAGQALSALGTDAASAGSLSATRSAAIRRALVRVRADLRSRQTQSSSPATRKSTSTQAGPGAGPPAANPPGATKTKGGGPAGSRGKPGGPGKKP